MKRPEMVTVGYATIFDGSAQHGPRANAVADACRRHGVNHLRLLNYGTVQLKERMAESVLDGLIIDYSLCKRIQDPEHGDRLKRAAAHIPVLTLDFGCGGKLTATPQSSAPVAASSSSG